jgi:hypothetical protein
MSNNFIPEEEHFLTMDDFNWRKKFPLLFSFVSLQPVGVADFLFLLFTHKDTKKMRRLQLSYIIYSIENQIIIKKIQSLFCP